MFVSSFSFSFSTFPFTPSPSFGLVTEFVGPFSFNTSACLLFAVDDRVTLLSLDMGEGRVVTFRALVRVTPLEPAFTAIERNLEAFVGLGAGSLDGAGGCSFALPLPFSSASTVPDAKGGAGAVGAASTFAGVVIAGDISGESCFSGGCGFGIVGATGRIDSGSGTRLAGGLEVEGTSGYGRMGIGGSTEADLARATRWGGGVGDLEGNRKDSGLGCGGIRCEGCLVGMGLGCGFGFDGGSSCGGCGGCGGSTGRSMFMGSVAGSLFGRSGGVDGSD